MDVPFSILSSFLGLTFQDRSFGMMPTERFGLVQGTCISQLSNACREYTERCTEGIKPVPNSRDDRFATCRPLKHFESLVGLANLVVRQEEI